ncbi:hypothetical protein BKA80DRAFT_268227 [Phyllosticta citrichinensis]
MANATVSSAAAGGKGDTRRTAVNSSFSYTPSRALVQHMRRVRYLVGSIAFGRSTHVCILFVDCRTDASDIDTQPVLACEPEPTTRRVPSTPPQRLECAGLVACLLARTELPLAFVCPCLSTMPCPALPCHAMPGLHSLPSSKQLTSAVVCLNRTTFPPSLPTDLRSCPSLSAESAALRRTLDPYLHIKLVLAG